MRYAVIGIAVSLSWAIPAQAGLFSDLYDGLIYFTTPSDGPLNFGSDGTAFNGSRSGRVRITENQLGDGFAVEINRAFGADSQGRPEILDLGAFELQLDGVLASTLSYTSRGFLVGNSDLSVQNLQYAIRGKTGAQDVELTGTLNVGHTLEINQFGFYTMNLAVNNTDSQATVDGVVVRDVDETNFNVGPITIEGNIFFDAFVGLLGSFGADISGLQNAFPESPIDRITQAFNAQMNQIVAGQSLQTALPLSAVTAQPVSSVEPQAITAPEPASLTGLLALSAGLRRRNR